MIDIRTIDHKTGTRGIWNSCTLLTLQIVELIR